LKIPYIKVRPFIPHRFLDSEDLLAPTQLQCWRTVSHQLSITVFAYTPHLETVSSMANLRMRCAIYIYATQSLFFEGQELQKDFVVQRMKEEENGGSCTMRSFIICTYPQIS
jgi:hypothetical protein